MIPRDTDPNEVLSSLAKRGVSLDLKPVDVCFLTALSLRAERTGLASLGEEELESVFADVALLFEKEKPDGAKRRAGSAGIPRTPGGSIQRLREQRVLARIDGAGLARQGEYALTRLGGAIVQFFIEEEALTGESLTVLTAALAVDLDAILVAAGEARDEAAWRTGVVTPLAVVVSELISGIERRQRGFDLQQEEFQKEIARLLQSDWFGAVDRCQALLDSAATALRELHDVLLSDAHGLSSRLFAIAELAADHGADGTRGAADADRAARHVADQVDRIVLWGENRQRAFSDYYQYVHRFLRDVVRLDPSRAVTSRLRELLSGEKRLGYALTVAAAPSIRLLRAVALPVAAPPVTRPKAKRPDESPDEGAEARSDTALDRAVEAEIASGARGLADVTARITAGLPPGERFRIAGRVASATAKRARIAAPAPRPWAPVGADLEIEDWTFGG